MPYMSSCFVSRDRFLKYGILFISSISHSVNSSWYLNICLLNKLANDSYTLDSSVKWDFLSKASLPYYSDVTVAERLHSNIIPISPK